MQWAKKSGFTIVELLIVVVVIAILAAVTIVAYSGIQTQSREAKIQADLASLKKAVMAARNSTGKTFYGISGATYTASGCTTLAAGTDIRTLDSSHTCWARYAQTLDLISTASGMNIRGLVDPWGRPYFIDENEGEGGGCSMDSLSVYALPNSGSTRMPNMNTSIPLSGFSGCS